MSARCDSCRAAAPYAVVLERPDGLSSFYCPPCAAGVPDEELPEQTVNARIFRRTVAAGARVAGRRGR